MEILKEKISKLQLKEKYSSVFETMTKGVADLKKGLIALDAEMHSDLEQLLLEEGSEQEDLWGFNLFADKENDGFIEYTSFINIRPRQGNKSMEIADPKIRDSVKKLVEKFIV